MVNQCATSTNWVMHAATSYYCSVKIALQRKFWIGCLFLAMNKLLYTYVISAIATYLKGAMGSETELDFKMARTPQQQLWG